jgi:hypothetical protein
MARPTGRRSNALDERLLTHHPAGKTCLEVCHANGWNPANGDVLRLVKLWDEVHEGYRSEDTLDHTRIEFARWLIRTGRLNEGANEGADGGTQLPTSA